MSVCRRWRRPVTIGLLSHVCQLPRSPRVSISVRVGRSSVPSLRLPSSWARTTTWTCRVSTSAEGRTERSRRDGERGTDKSAEKWSPLNPCQLSSLYPLTLSELRAPSDERVGSSNSPLRGWPPQMTIRGPQISTPLPPASRNRRFTLLSSLSGRSDCLG